MRLQDQDERRDGEMGGRKVWRREREREEGEDGRGAKGDKGRREREMALE